MAIRIIEGAIGSGKTFYAVWHLVRNYFSWNTKKEEWQAREDVEVYSNIEGFKLGKSLADAISKAGGLPAFFNVEYQRNFIPENKKVIYIIDEAQGPDFFHRKFYNPETFYFFQYSRHLGVDVYFLTQDVSTLARELQNLAEYHIQVRRRSLSLTGEFTYRFLSGGESFKSKTLRPDARIFALYRSMQKGEVEKLPSAARRWAFMFIGLIGLAGFLFYYLFLGFLPGKTSGVSDAQAHKEKPSISLPVLSQAPEKLPEPQTTPEAPQVPVYVQYEVLGLIGDSEDVSIGYVLYRPLDKPSARVLRAERLEFDRLCRCNSLAKLRAGDVVQVQVGEL